MDQQDLKPKKSFLSQFWWIWLILIIGLAIFALIIYKGHKDDLSLQTKEGTIIGGGKDQLTRPFGEAELSAADLAISRGIKIDDPQNDWYKFPAGSTQPDGRADNSNPYPLGWTDYKSLSVGADENFIYFKYEFWDRFPKEAVTYNGDLIYSTGAKIDSLSFINPDGKNDTADLGAGPWYVTMQNDNWIKSEQPLLSHGAMISPMGRDEKLETVFKVHTGAGMVGGGPGYNYVLDAYPLSLFNLKLGNTVTFHSSTETGSSKYHHEAFDILVDMPGSTDSRFGRTIKYQLGSDRYEFTTVDERNFS